MVMIRFRAQIATDPNTGVPRPELIGQSGQIVEEGTTTVVPIYEDKAKTLPIPSSALVIGSSAFVPQFWVEDTYELDWWDGTNRVPIESNAGAREAAQDAAVAAAAAFGAAVADVVALAESAANDAEASASSAAEAAAAAEANSEGLPAGGNTGDVLVKLSGADRVAGWAAPTGGGGVSSTWDTLAGKPSTFPPAGHTQSVDTLSDATAVGRAVLRSNTASAARDAIGAGTSNQNLSPGTTAGTYATGDHTHSQYLTGTQVDDKIAAAGITGGGGGGNIWWISSATAARINPTTSAALPAGAHVFWVCDTEPVNLDPTLDMWLPSA